jgi:hypothetical protein
MLSLITTVAIDLTMSISWWVTKQIATGAVNAISYFIS